MNLNSNYRQSNQIVWPEIIRSLRLKLQEAKAITLWWKVCVQCNLEESIKINPMKM